jgi:ribose/xylose/arabinose/galactoside ABC-type transport system permease subunit
MAGLAGIIQAARRLDQPNAGVAYELDAIAAVVIGGRVSPAAWVVWGHCSACYC